jgi:hypothetical protein
LFLAIACLGFGRSCFPLQVLFVLSRLLKFRFRLAESIAFAHLPRRPFLGRAFRCNLSECFKAGSLDERLFEATLGQKLSTILGDRSCVAAHVASR